MRLQPMTTCLPLHLPRTLCYSAAVVSSILNSRRAAAAASPAGGDQKKAPRPGRGAFAERARITLAVLDNSPEPIERPQRTPKMPRLGYDIIVPSNVHHASSRALRALASCNVHPLSIASHLDGRPRSRPGDTHIVPR